MIIENITIQITGEIITTSEGSLTPIMKTMTTILSMVSRDTTATTMKEATTVITITMGETEITAKVTMIKVGAAERADGGAMVIDMTIMKMTTMTRTIRQPKLKLAICQVTHMRRKAKKKWK